MLRHAMIEEIYFLIRIRMECVLLYRSAPAQKQNRYLLIEKSLQINFGINK